MLERKTESATCTPQSTPKRHRPWQEHASNKRQKKKIIQGVTKGTSRQRSQEKREQEECVRTECPQIVSSLVDSFRELPDPRVNRRRRHLLIDIIIIAVLGVMCGAGGWKEIQIWGQANEQWLSTFLELPNGIPSRDTLRRTVSRLDPIRFEQTFVEWLSGIRKIEGVVAIDGKTARGSGHDGENPLHIVSAWACEQHLTLGQRAVDGKSNEITAIPELLATLVLKGAIVTIDAMGCQKNIAAQIVAARGDYCLAVKDNQPTLAEDVAAAFAEAMEKDFASVRHDYHETTDKGHGRQEQRCYYTMPAPASLRTGDQWEGLKSIGLAITFRDGAANCDGDVRYYITSFASDAERFANAVRSHWGIENSLHWVMDVTFGEDDCRIHKDHGTENMSWLRRLAITLIKLDTTMKDSIRAKRIRAGYDTEFLKQMLSSISDKF